MKVYADRKGWPLERVHVQLNGHREDDGFHIERTLRLTGALSDEQRTRLVEIAEKCPVAKDPQGNDPDFDGTRLAAVRRGRPRTPKDAMCRAALACQNHRMTFLELVTIVVHEYDPAIEFFVERLGFELVEDSPSSTNDGRPKRWVVVRPPRAQTGILLARADGEHQVRAVGAQVAGRVGFFLRVDDFEARYQEMVAAGVVFVTKPRQEAYGRVAVFLDIAGNRWDLLGAV